MSPETGEKELAIIIVSYNTREETLDCLRSVQEHLPSCSHDVIVIDNASSDGSADAIAGEFPQFRLIRSDENLGFAKANNVAAAMVESRLILLLNPDTIILDGAVQEAVDFAGRCPEARIWGGRTLFADRSLNLGSCWRRQTWWSLTCRGFGLSALARGSSLFNPESYGSWPRDDEREVDIVTGCFMLIDRSLWNELDGFDEHFFMYGEEADFCLRARSRGARPRITPKATLIHLGGASERVRADMLVRLLTAKAGLIRRHWSAAMVPFGLWMLLQWCVAHACIWTILALIGKSGARDLASSWWAGWNRRGEWLRRSRFEAGARGDLNSVSSAPEHLHEAG